MKRPVNDLMKKSFSLLLALALCLTALTACERFTDSDYTAEGFVHSRSETAASASFLRLTGRYVFRLHAYEASALRCMARLEEGEMTLWYKINGHSARKITAVAAGGPIDEYAGSFKPSDMVYVVIETAGDCRGEVEQR